MVYVKSPHYCQIRVKKRNGPKKRRDKRKGGMIEWIKGTENNDGGKDQQGERGLPIRRY